MVEKTAFSGSIFSGSIDANLKRLRDEIQNDPARPELRIFYFQLLCIRGEYEKAMTQLNLAADMDETNLLMAQVCRSLLNCEVLRDLIFKGEQSPLVFGDPQPWLGLMVKALALDGKEYPAAAQLRNDALASAQPVPGTINGDPFEWLADADSRLGPILEIIAEGRYYLTAFSNMEQMTVSQPCDLRDVIWLPCSVVWRNGGQSVGFIPARYHGSVETQEDVLLLGRKTLWNQIHKDLFFGVGQRMLATDRQEYPIMDVRQIRFNHNQM